MAGKLLDSLIRHLRHTAGARLPNGLSDAQLLDRFVRRRDEAAFEVLVWRHGALVWGVCRRVLRGAHDAEDAFQATFLVLARKAGAIGNRESVGSWLYKVAYRVALRARSAPALPLPDELLPDRTDADPATHLLGRELTGVLDEEVHRLPEKYRVPFVLCHLQGQTLADAARTLGCPVGTVGTRLSRARELLRGSLARRGYPTLPLAGSGAATPSVQLVGATVQAALFRTTEQAVAAGVISAHAAHLTRGVMRTMYLTTSARTLLVLLGVGLFGGVALLAHWARAVEPVPAQTTQPVVAQAAQQPEQDVPLRWKFVKDRPFFQEVTTVTDQRMKVMGNTVGQQQTLTLYNRWTPTRKDGDSWELRQRIEGVKHDVDIGGSRTSFDSTNDRGGAAVVLAEVLRSLVGTEYKVVLDREYRVEKAEGDFPPKKADNPATEILMSQIMTESAVRQTAEISFAGLPRHPVRPGDSWTVKRKMDLGSGGEYVAQFRYTYEGKRGNLDQITIKMEGLRKGPPTVPGGAFTVKKSELDCAGTGTLLFDRDAGYAISQELTLKVQGKMTVVLGGQESELDIFQTQKITVKTTGTNPIRKAAPPPADDKDREIQRLREENERLKRQLKAIEEALRGGKPPG